MHTLDTQKTAQIRTELTIRQQPIYHTELNCLFSNNIKKGFT